MKHTALINQLILYSGACMDPAKAKTLKDAASAIIELQDSLPKWIPVDEQIPQPYQGVIIAREKEKGKPLKVEAGMMKPDGYWKVYGTNTKGVIYWMPLPEAPEILKEDL
ncbi:MAG: DUF551 domain-containing protein [Oscillospiraceae bacterium]|nr:DUF551 domain-containing protein [Oscillospiraceae bacterium]